jgi:hypothetical protein
MLINFGVSTLEAPNENEMYSSCILIISIKHLCFTPCVLSGYHSFSMFYLDQLQTTILSQILGANTVSDLFPCMHGTCLSTSRVVGGRSLV